MVPGRPLPTVGSSDGARRDSPETAALLRPTRDRSFPCQTTPQRVVAHRDELESDEGEEVEAEIAPQLSVTSSAS
jgi:hypothetical protein